MASEASRMALRSNKYMVSRKFEAAGFNSEFKFDLGGY